MAQQELATTIAELPEVIEQLKARKLLKNSRVRLIWDEEVDKPKKQAKNADIQALLDDLKKLKKPSAEGQKAFEEGREAFRDTFNL